MYKIGDTVNLIIFKNNDCIEEIPYTVIDFTQDGYAVCENKDKLDIIFAKVTSSLPLHNQLLQPL